MIDPTIYNSPEEFKVESGVYQIPFVALDPTPGWGNLWRIMWNFEIIKTRDSNDITYIAELAVWASQTRDPKLMGRCFKFFLNTEQLSLLNILDPNPGMVSSVSICSTHNAPVITMYPENKHNALKIKTYSSIMADIKFIHKP